MIFVPYPSLSPEDRWQSAIPIDMSRLRVSPAEAISQVSRSVAIRLTGIEGRPVYILSRNDEPDFVVAGDTGEAFPQVSPAMAQRIAEEFKQRNARAITQPIMYDQWIVYDELDPQRPFYRVSFADDETTEIYVSARTGEVLQETSGHERFWNWFGSIVHWIYFTPIRRSWTFWDQLVWWISIVGVAVTAAGLVQGFHRTLHARQQGTRGLSQFRGWMRWHHTIGLFAGVVVFTWILSGWLSMDHGRLFSTGQPTADQTARMAGQSLIGSLTSVPVTALRAFPAPMEIRFSSVASQTVLSVTSSGQPPTAYIVRNENLQPQTVLPDNLLLSGINMAWPSARMTSRGNIPVNSFYALAEAMGPTTRAFSSQSGPDLTVYVDGLSGRITKVMDDSRRAYAWAFYALHTFRVPGSESHNNLRIFVILVLLAVGFAFSMTGVIIGVRHLQKMSVIR